MCRLLKTGQANDRKSNPRKSPYILRRTNLEIFRRRQVSVAFPERRCLRTVLFP